MDMRCTVLAVLFGLAGCMTGETVDSTQSAIIEGDWVLAPSVSDHPIQSDQVPAGVESTPVDLVLTGDGLILACDNGVPMGGYDPTGGDTGDPDGQLPGFRPEEQNAPLRPVDSSDGMDDPTGSSASDSIGAGGMYTGDQPLSGMDIESTLPLPDDVWLFHPGCQ
jgi:hypothetical protein